MEAKSAPPSGASPALLRGEAPGPRKAPPQSKRFERGLWISLGAVLAGIVISVLLILSMITYPLPTTHPFSFAVSTPGGNSGFRGYDQAFCLPHNAASNGSVWFSWHATSGTPTFEVETIAIPPVANATIYKSPGNASAGSGSIWLVNDGLAGACGLYLFGLSDPAPSSAFVNGFWNYSADQPLL